MTEAQLQTFVERWLQSWTGNRSEELLGFYAADAYYQDPARPAGLRGHEQIGPYFQRLLAANPEWVWEPLEIIPTPGGCCLKWKATVPKQQGMASLVGLDIVEIADDRITRNEVYFDPAALR